MTRQRSTISPSRQHWLWVTRHRYYLDADGSDRASLDPAAAEDSGGSWTCHRSTQEGDFALLWRTCPRSDIGYLFTATTDAFSITDDPEAAQKNWDYACEFRPVYKFQKPLTIADIRQDPYLEEWSAVGARFQRKTFAIPINFWTHLMQRLSEANPGFSKALAKVDAAPPSIPGTEKELEDRLLRDLKVLLRHGFDLELRGRQVVLNGHGGRIDLLCFDRKARRYVVVELKNVQAGQNTFGQVMTYMGWVRGHHPNRRPPLGLVIARGFDNRFLSAEANKTGVSHLTLEKVDLL